MRDFGNLERLKQISKVIVSVRSDTPSDVTVSYRTDLEERADRTALVVAGNDRLSERDLTQRDLSVSNAPAVFVRKPMCKHVRCFSFSLESNSIGDMSILSAQILYQFLGRDK